MEQEDLLGRDAQPDTTALAAHRLTVYFSEDDELPARYRRSKPAKARKIKEDAVLEKRFKANVKSWTQVIETMLAKIDHRQAWRFINLAPEVSPTARKVTDCEDFRAFNDYLILRRDKEGCCANELGGLTWLLTTFQRKIEKRIRLSLS